jgi:hypothetical protein
VWDFKLKSGDMQGAQRAASQMLQHYKTASMQYRGNIQSRAG